jgi:hypothetical protein
MIASSAWIKLLSKGGCHLLITNFNTEGVDQAKAEITFSFWMNVNLKAEEEKRNKKKFQSF